MKNKFNFLLTSLKALTLLLVMMLGVGNVWGYQIVFKTGSGDGSNVSTSTACSDIVSEGASYLSGNVATATKAYYNGSNGVKLGTGSAAGTLKMNLSTAGQITPSSVVITAKRYSSSKEATIKLNGSAIQSLTSDFQDYTFDGFTSAITYLEIVSSKYVWVQKVVVNGPKTDLTFTAGENGSASVYSDAERTQSISPTGNVYKVDQNSTVYFTASPDKDYEVDTWTNATADAQDNTKASLAVGTTAATASVTFKPVATTCSINPTLVLNDAIAKTTADADFTPEIETEDVGAGQTITYASSNSDVATIVDNKVHIVGAGTSNITASVAADGDYCAATSDPCVLTVTKQKYTVTWMANGSQFAQSTEVEDGSALVLPSPAPTSAACDDKKVFVGWTATENYSSPSAAPSDLFTSAGDKTVTGNLTYYAVFATSDGTTPCYKYVNAPEEGKTYIIVSQKTAGSAYALPANGLGTSAAASITGTAVTVYSVDDDIIVAPLTADLEFLYESDDDAAWKVVASTSNEYLLINGSGIGKAASDYKAWWDDDNGGIYGSNSKNNKWYDVYLNGSSFKAAENKAGSVFAFEKQTPLYTDYVTVCVPPTFTITFDGNGATSGSMSDVTGIAKGGSTTLVTNGFIKTGYNFSKWKDQDNNEYSNQATITNITKDLTLTAQWISKTIDLVLDGVDDNATDGVGAAEYDGDAIITTNAAWDQHELNGYYTASTGGTLVLSSDGTLSASVEGYTDANAKWIKDADEAVTLYAQWTSLAKYNISYDLTGCTANSENPTEIALDAESVTLSFSLASGNYTWDGALAGVTMGGVDLEDSEITFTAGTLIITPSNGFKGNIEATIICDYAPATLTLSENGSESSYGSNLKVNDQVTLPNCEVQCDKAFVGWSEKNADITASDILAVGASYALTATSNKLYAVFATETPGETTDVYTLTITQDGGKTGYANTYDITVSNITWNVPGNQNTGSGVKLGGKLSSATDRALYSKTAIASKVSKVVANHGAKDSEITVNSLTLDVYSTAALAAAGGSGDVSSVSGTYIANGNTTFDCPSTDDWTGRFYRITYNLSSSASGSNKGIKLESVKMQSVAAPEYSDYSVTCSAKTAAPEFSLTAGEYNEAKELTITAETGAKIYYNINSDDDPTSESTEYTEAIQLNTWGTKTIKAIALADGKSVSDLVSATYVMNLPFTSLEELVAADVPSGTTVTVSFSDVEITSLNGTNGVSLNVQKEEKDIQIYCSSVARPDKYVVGGKLSATNLTCAWVRYSQSGTFKCWELTPSNWDGFSYTDPAHITSIVISGEPTKKSYTDGQTLESDGLVVTGYYNDHTELVPHSEVITEGLTWTLPTLTEGQPTAEVKVKYTEPILSQELTSAAYQVTGLTVSAAKVLQSIYVADDSEHQTKFFVGRPFSSAGLKVMAKYSIGDDEQITPTSISTPSMTSEGEQTVTITYTEKTVEKQTSYTITLAYMDLSDLVAATDINDGDYVYVKFSDQQIKSFYTSKGSNKGIYFDIQKGGNDIEIYAQGTACPSTWEQYGTVSATLNNVQWTKYGDTWELKPSNWDAFTYNGPNVPVQSITIDPAAVSVGETKTTQLSIVYTPTYATNKGVTWAVTEGSDKASVDADGKVTGNKEGLAIVTATLTADPTIQATCSVTVTATAKCTISYVVKGEEASTQTIVRSEEGVLTYVPAAVSGHEFVGWAESDVTSATATPVTVITKYTPGAEEANKTLYAVYKYEDTSVEGYGVYNKITSAPADWSGKYLFVSELGNCAVKGSAITSSSLSHTPVTIDKEHGVIAANDALLPEVLEIKKGTTNYTIKGGNGMYFTYNGKENGFSAATTGAIEYPIAYDGTNMKTVITCPTEGGATMQVNEQTSGDNKYYTFRFYKSAQKALQLYKLVEGTFYYTSYPSAKYTITFNADGGTGACAKIVVNAGESATICEEAPTKALNKFNNWSDGTTTYAPGATIENVSKDITLTAQWIAKVPYTITFDKNGAEGTAPESITDYEGNQVTLPTKGDMSYEGFLFKGWNDGTTTYAGGAKFIMPEQNVTMTAVWQDASVTHWALVINDKQLKAGDKVLIVAAKYEKALAAQNDVKYRDVVNITKSTDTYFVTESDNEPTTLTVGITDGKFTFHDGNGYLYSPSASSNYMSVQTQLNDSGMWNVSIANGVATISSVGNTTKPLMQYNTGNPRVACYGSAQSAGDLAIYKYYETAPEFVKRDLTSANIVTSCIAKGGVEEFAFSGATFFEILDKDAEDKNVTLQEVTTLVAGMPYIIQPVEGANKVLMMVGGDEATAQHSNGLYGWLDNDYMFSYQIDSKDVYFVSGGKIKRCGTDCTIKTNRAYIVLDEIGQDPTPAVPGRRTLSLGVQNTDISTDIYQLTDSPVDRCTKLIIDNQLIIIRNGKQYNAAGALVK